MQLLSKLQDSTINGLDTVFVIIIMLYFNTLFLALWGENVHHQSFAANEFGNEIIRRRTKSSNTQTFHEAASARSFADRESRKTSRCCCWQSTSASRSILLDREQPWDCLWLEWRVTLGFRNRFSILFEFNFDLFREKKKGVFREKMNRSHPRPWPEILQNSSLHIPTVINFAWRT